jgi:hypothetical protein
LNLDPQQQRQVKTSLNSANETVELRLQEAYSWLLVPEQPDPLGDIEIRTSRISGSDNFYDRAARRLETDGALIRQWSPDILRMELDRYIWGEDKDRFEVGLKDLWDYLARYCYFPRLLDRDVLKSSIDAGVNRVDAPFAYAARKDEDGYHRGVLYQQMGSIYFDDQSMLVHPDHLNRKPQPNAAPTRSQPVDGGGKSGAATTPEPEDEPGVRKTCRYYGKVALDPQRLQRDMTVIVEEVVQRLTSQLGTDVEITLEIRANKPDGFEESTMRTVNENSRTLNFDQFGFEE